MSITLKEKFKTFSKLLFEPKILNQVISFRQFGYLVETGWLNSFKSGSPVDIAFKPIPWFTYSAIDFLNEKLNSKLSVLEFGSGNSTFFLAERVKRVISFEHNETWLRKVLLKKPVNVELKITVSSTSKDYLEPLSDYLEFDIIIVDSLFRNECLSSSLNHLSELGVIILDDSEREDYKEGIKFLLASGFKQLNFSGIAPGIFFRKCTTIFYKNKNCLDI